MRKLLFLLMIGSLMCLNIKDKEVNYVKVIFENLGVTSDVAQIMEVIFYIITIIASCIVLFKQFRKALKLMIVAVHKCHTLRQKCSAVKAFSKWFSKAILDGKITDEEITAINVELASIQLRDVVEEDIKSN